MFAFPLRDVIPSRTTPLVTIGLIVVNAIAFLVQQGVAGAHDEVLVSAHRFIPAPMTPATLLTSTFLHGGWIHLLGNMLFLWIFGETVEDRLGHGRFLALYLLCGAAAGFAQTLATPGPHVATIGASGAIAGVLGAYFLLFPRSRVLTFVFLFVFIDIVEVPAVFFLAFWFLLQLVSGVVTLGPAGGGVAVWAHGAGFGAGMLLLALFRRRERERMEWVEGLE